MKIFTETCGNPGKINFVDKNNVVVGFDTNQKCCEMADWFIAYSPKFQIKNRNPVITSKDNGYINNDNIDLSLFKFDTNFLMRTGTIEDVEDPDYNGGGIIIFRLKNTLSGRFINNKPLEVIYEELFLHIYNAHNGYYYHNIALSTGDGEMLYKDII